MSNQTPNMQELGVTGLTLSGDWVNEAHTAELKWPDCEPLYRRIWRSDPEVTIARNVLSAWAGGVEINAEIPTRFENGDEVEPSDDDKRARDFVQTVLLDVENGFVHWVKDCITKVPFYGWGWWEVVPGIRSVDWRPPGDDPWESKYDDNLIGFRRLAHRRYSTFYGWDFFDNGKVKAFLQDNMVGEHIPIPLDRSLHIVYGDFGSPEGVGTMEALWRLERIKYGLEVVQGIGFEHSSGHLSITVEEGGNFDDAKIQQVARNVLTSQPGNFAAWPNGITADFIDARFGSAEAILAAIQHYGILKLALLGMQFVAISTLTGSGSYASLSDASTVALSIFNNILSDMLEQSSQQLVSRLFTYRVNAAAFPGITRLPKIGATEMKKPVNIGELATFLTALKAVMGLTFDDLNAIRKESGFLPQINEGDEILVPEKEEPQPQPQPQPQTNTSEEEPPDENEEMANYPDIQIAYDEVTFDQEEINEIFSQIKDPVLKKALFAEVIEPAQEEAES